jgi:hypothetical protein
MGSIIGLPFLKEIATWTFQHCQPYEDGFVADLLILTRYSDPLLTLFIFAASLARQEIYLLFFGLGAILSSLLNWVLRKAVADHTRVVATCTDAYGDDTRWPSWQTQNASFLVAFVVTYPLLYNAGMPVYYSFLLFLFYFAVVAGDEMLNYHTRSQIIGGVLVGVVFAFLWQMVIRAIVPHFPYIMSYPQVNALGYVDTLCMPDKDFVEEVPAPRDSVVTVLVGGKFDYDMKSMASTASDGEAKES